jgi:hypothetical protein
MAGLVGCSSDWGSTPNQNHYLRISVRVLNGETQLPLSGVVFKICDFEATSSTDGDGHSFIEVIPGIANANVRVTLERSGFGALGMNVPVFPNTTVFNGNLQERNFIDLGTVWMRPAEPVTAHVTRDGAPLGGAVLYAVQSEFAYDGTGEFDCTDLNIVGTTNASGVATMNGFDPTLFYEFVVPTQDTDGDGIPDVRTATSGLRIVDDGNTIAINTQTLGPNTGPDITGDNLVEFRNSNNLQTFTLVGGDGSQGFEGVDVNEGVVTANGSVQVVFWNPVSITGANFRYRNNLVAVSDPDFDQDLRISATATALAGSDSTIFNFVPLTPLPTNESVNLNFIARSLVDPTSSRNMDIDDIYVALHLGTIPFAIDNYNGSRDGSGGSRNVYLRFNEYVEGFYKVLEFHPDTTSVTFQDPFEWSLNSGGHEIINNQDAAPLTGTNSSSGAVAGKQYRVHLLTPNGNFFSLNDDTGIAINTVTIEISVRNIVGTTLDGVFTVPVE